MKIVKLIPKSKKAKDRVNEHGDQFELLVDKEEKFLVRSLEDTFSYGDGAKGKWLGWMEKEKEANWEEIK